MRLKFCAACGSAGDLQHHHIVAGPPRLFPFF